MCGRKVACTEAPARKESSASKSLNGGNARGTIAVVTAGDDKTATATLQDRLGIGLSSWFESVVPGARRRIGSCTTSSKVPASSMYRAGRGSDQPAVAMVRHAVKNSGWGIAEAETRLGSPLDQVSS